MGIPQVGHGGLPVPRTITSLSDLDRRHNSVETETPVLLIVMIRSGAPEVIMIQFIGLDGILPVQVWEPNLEPCHARSRPLQAGSAGRSALETLKGCRGSIQSQARLGVEHDIDDKNR